MRDLNTLYRGEPALHEVDCDPAGFEWIDANDSDNSMLTFVRRGKDPRGRRSSWRCNFTPVPREDYRIGVPRGGRWDEMLNSDAPLYGGSGVGNLGGVEAVAGRLARAGVHAQRHAAAVGDGAVQASGLVCGKRIVSRARGRKLASFATASAHMRNSRAATARLPL